MVFSKQVLSSKYVHLCMGLLLLYGVSSAITHTSRDEKIVARFADYCRWDYVMMDEGLRESQPRAFFHREEFRQRLETATSGLFDYRDKKQAQAFLMSKGFLYEAWQVNEEFHSYLLAEIVASGSDKAEVPEVVTFDYYILGKKKIPPFAEFLHGRWARNLVSAGDKKAYIHRDSLDYILEWYFDSLWEREPKDQEDFYWDLFTFALYRDLQPLCEDTLIKHEYGTNKRMAKRYFMEKGFEVFLPTLLTMGAKMVSDQGSRVKPAKQYQRAMLTGLALKPRTTMLFSCEYNPTLKELRSAFTQNLDIHALRDLSLERISEVARRMMESREYSF